MKQITHNTTFSVHSHWNKFLQFPQFQTEEHKRLKLYIPLHCGPDIIASLTCGLEGVDSLRTRGRTR